MIFTIIANAVGDSKLPIPNNKDDLDDTFSFVNVDIPLEHCHEAFHKYFMLTRPISKDIRSKRDSSLEPLYVINNNYVVIDFDKVKDKKSIIDYFNNNNYAANIFNSRNNLKAVVLVNFSTTRKNIEAFLSMIDKDLSGLCEIDVSSARNASYQAPTKKEGYMYLNLDGYKCELDDIKDFIQEHKPIIEYDDIDVQWFWNKFISDYGMKPKDYFNTNGTIQCSLPTEVKTKFSYYWNKSVPWILQHPNKNKSINIFDDFIKSQEGKEYIKSKRLNQFKSHFTLNSNISVNERYFKLTEEIKNTIDTFISTPKSVLAIKGVMGSGKSNLLEYIKKPRTLYISVRRSLSYDIKEKYKCKHYMEDIYSKDKDRYRPGDSLVVQIDSLHKINIKHFDFVIIDEFESFCLYTQNSMSNSDYYMQNMNIIKTIFDEKNIVIADAFLNQYSMNMYFGNNKKFIIQNKYKDVSKVYLYKYKHTFISMLEQVIFNKKEDEIITCSFGTLNEMKTIKKILETNKIRVLYLDSNTTDEAREMANSLLKKESVTQYDVVLFSPTITVGISILNNVAHHFHYDTGKSVDTISSVQMTKRSRTAKYIHLFLSGCKPYKPFDPDILNEDLLKVINSVNKSEVCDKSIFFNYDTNSVSNIGKFINKFIAHKNFYTGNNVDIISFLLAEQFDNITHIEDNISNNNFEKVYKDILKQKREIKLKNITNIDIQDYDKDYYKKNMSDQEILYQSAIRLKTEFFMLSDELIVEIINSKKSVIDNIRYILFYVSHTQEKRKEIVNEMLITSLKTIINHSQDNIKNLMMLSNTNIKLYDTITKKEVDNLIAVSDNFLAIMRLLGYKKRSGGLFLPNIFKKVIKEL